jgi:hypothetical protein
MELRDIISFEGFRDVLIIFSSVLVDLVVNNLHTKYGKSFNELSKVFREYKLYSFITSNYDYYSTMKIDDIVQDLNRVVTIKGGILL